MDAFASALNDLLVNTFRSILKLEEQMLNRLSQDQLSINELHMLEAIAREGDGGRTITDIARELSITLPSVTTAVNKLARKGYVHKHKSDADGRVVFVRLADSGRRAETAHRIFHRRMVSTLSRGLDPQQKQALMAGLQNLLAFFRSQQASGEQKEPNTD